MVSQPEKEIKSIFLKRLQSSSRGKRDAITRVSHQTTNLKKKTNQLKQAPCIAALERLWKGALCRSRGFFVYSSCS
ncbi:hypothetical protein AAFF_G00268970 [Aldrovandia affinis]|uniref:Uncharacterized protein n=1 Tax=Aldrovandia affinis TaxID=143900 RepID=A0AAD7STF9_9TELE|nr:hypothetical protein AAFF_G00268970 [Aldrovandia affinis]